MVEINPEIAVINPDGPQLLSREIISQNQNGSFRRVRLYYHGYYPKMGQLCNGWSGNETRVERDEVRAIGVFNVLPETTLA